MARIYLSSTGKDLNAHREAVLRVLRQAGHEMVTTHDLSGKGRGWLQACQKAVRDCDVFIGILAWQRGHVPSADNPKRKSSIELEFLQAWEADIPCHIFLLDDQVSWPNSSIDADRRKIDALRKDLHKRKVVTYFEDESQLVTSALRAVSTCASRAGKNPGLTLATHRERLRLRQKKLQAELTSTNDQQRQQVLKMELQIVQDKIENLGQSYETAITRNRQLARALEELHSQFPEAQLHEALEAVRSGNSSKAKQLFQEVLANGGISFGAAAYQLGKIAESEIDYQTAIVCFEKALNFEPTNSAYLSSLGIAYDMVGQYDHAIGYYELALASDVKAYGEVDPHVARDFSNLGSVWNSKGEYDIAIEYYGQALASDLLTYGEANPEVARRRDNLELARESKDIYEKAIGFVERSLEILRKKLGDDHPDTLLVLQKLDFLKEKK